MAPATVAVRLFGAGGAHELMGRELLSLVHLEIVVSDQGVGFDPRALQGRAAPAAGGFGLFSIRERVNLLGGRMEIHSAPQQGTRISLSAPVRRPAGPKPAPRAIAVPASAAPTAPMPDRAGGAPPAISVLLADDHVVMREGLSALLSGEADIRVVGEASDGLEALELARRLRPDVVLMDFSMPRMNGLEATRALHAELPEIRVIGLSMYEEADRAAAMLKAGAAAYVTKSGRPEALLTAIRRRAPRPAAPAGRAQP